MSINPQLSSQENFGKWSFENLLRLERGSYELLRIFENDLEQAIIENDKADAILPFANKASIQENVWKQVSDELYERVDKLLSISEILSIPVSTIGLTTGQG